ncbi:MAG: hypothetical protein K0U42_10030 [Actinomycetia bacterium]|nr:hypothetical protein [Actinomycetes bacterium]
MGLFDVIRGRKEPARSNLDALFALPSAAITLDIDLGLTPTGVGSVCFRAPEGKAFADLEAEIRELLDADGGPRVEASADSFGFDWLTIRTDPVDLATAVTDIHAVNTSLVLAGFGPQLLCSLFPFADKDGNAGALVYLYKRGTFYPFFPKAKSTDQVRNNVVELHIRDKLTGELPVELDTTRWFALWDAPGLS